MQSKAKKVNDYLEDVPQERKEYFSKLRTTILENLPDGFQEEMSYGMIGYVVPHSIYPAGYHVTPDLPLPFVSIASQKNHIALYHMGLYASPKIMGWFKIEYPKHSKLKLDMGKSCIRFRKPEQIPFALIGQLMKKMAVREWIEIYEAKVKKKR